MSERKIVYEIYPMSFKDTNGDGVGDIKGIISKLNYLQDLGVNYIWITPIYMSPFNDNGYDVSDYFNVNPKFGTNNDLKLLIFEAKKHKINVMLDMVFNHTSIAHKWFKGWINNDKKYKNFYIGLKSPGKPPTNWASKFGGSAWEEYKKDHWYLHLFDKSQADLNWENSQVREKLKEVIRFYIKLGVKGFRFDVINLISKNNYKNDKNGDGRKFYTDGNRAHEFIRELSEEFPNDSDFLTVGELSSTSIKDSIKYSNNKGTELNSVFTFHHLKIDYDKQNKFIDLDPNIKKLNTILKKWYSNFYKKGSQMASFLSNHDQPRSVSRFINREHRNEGGKMLFALMASLPGIPFIYQGEEIGMENADFKNIDDFRDVESINYLKGLNSKKIPKGLLKKTRDNARTPFQWNKSMNAGFTTGKPWIKINDNFKTINADSEIKNSDSIFNFYKDYIDFIKVDIVLNNGNIKFNNYKNKIISYSRSYNNKEYKFVFSFNNVNVKCKFDKNKIIKSNYKEIVDDILKPYQFFIEER